MSVDAKILQLICMDDNLALDIDDWEWNGKFEQVSAFWSWLNGHWIDVYNPSVHSATTTGPVKNIQTYSFRTAAVLLTPAENNLHNAILDITGLPDELPSPVDFNNGDDTYDSDSDVFNEENVVNIEYC
ncbi:hypothetical protein EDD18DRAFT_1343212 [Armillaria luteobubalina]|uniref:Uncharacterized protein n=1 Tax=Armillaria luteobubalina TaxID=153913 RepID=A0AA39QRY5_9AGAR|nr:hypothetical protein EDD18DRAFT_1343212 [Armillaria luteobubalina]